MFSITGKSSNLSSSNNSTSNASIAISLIPDLVEVANNLSATANVLGELIKAPKNIGTLKHVEMETSAIRGQLTRLEQKYKP